MNPMIHCRLLLLLLYYAPRVAATATASSSSWAAEEGWKIRILSVTRSRDFVGGYILRLIYLFIFVLIYSGLPWRALSAPVFLGRWCCLVTSALGCPIQPRNLCSRHHKFSPLCSLSLVHLHIFLAFVFIYVVWIFYSIGFKSYKRRK